MNNLSYVLSNTLFNCDTKQVIISSKYNENSFFSCVLFTGTHSECVTYFNNNKNFYYNK